MKLTKAQKEALENTPLYYCQGEYHPNTFVYVSDSTDKEFQARTVRVLIDKGLLIESDNMVIKKS